MCEGKQVHATDWYSFHVFQTICRLAHILRSGIIILLTRCPQTAPSARFVSSKHACAGFVSQRRHKRILALAWDDVIGSVGTIKIRLVFLYLVEMEPCDNFAVSFRWKELDFWRRSRNRASITIGCPAWSSWQVQILQSQQYWCICELREWFVPHPLSSVQRLQWPDAAHMQVCSAFYELAAIDWCLWVSSVCQEIVRLPKELFPEFRNRHVEPCHSYTSQYWECHNWFQGAFISFVANMDEWKTCGSKCSWRWSYWHDFWSSCRIVQERIGFHVSRLSESRVYWVSQLIDDPSANMFWYIQYINVYIYIYIWCCHTHRFMTCFLQKK